MLTARLAHRVRESHALGMSQRGAAWYVGRSQKWVHKAMRELGLKPNGHDCAASRARKRVAAFGAHGRAAPLQQLEVLFPCDFGSVATPDGYALFAALCAAGWPVRCAPDAPPDTQILGTPAGLLVRCAESRLSRLLAAPRGVRVQGRPVRFGDPVSRPVPECAAAESRLVVVRGYDAPEPLRDYLSQQLAGYGIEGRVEMGARRVVWVKRHAVAGFGVRVSDLSPLGSRLLLARGLGGRRHFGCGVFVPC